MVAAATYSISINKKVLKNKLKTINTHMDNAIKLIGQTNSTDENTLINKIEQLNKDFHDTATVAKAYEAVNTALAKLESQMITIDDQMVTLQAYYDLLMALSKS